MITDPTAVFFVLAIVVAVSLGLEKNVRFFRAFGAALVIGPLLALVRPPKDVAGDGEEAQRPPLGRTVAMIVIGAIAAVWGAASLLS